ncbi:MAG: heme-binding protein [Campylobacterota bacterium]|nr:heme-binding protein [Campylobacterota bacterium]
MLRIMLLSILLQGALMAIEEPKYSVIQKNDTYEIRNYAPYVVAQTEVSGRFDDMGGKAFKILFNYISGGNKQRSKVKMTAPVIQESSKPLGQKIQMTAPVIQKMDSTTSQISIYSFVMPQSFNLESLPEPLDNRITLKQIPAKTVAVRVFSGWWEEENFKQNETILMNALNKAGVKIIGKPNFARYNSPFSLWFMRRNEIMIEVKQ